jgi:general secretion pathway protein K
MSARIDKGGERGIALLMVLMIVSLLTAVIVDFSYQTRLDARLAGNVRDALEASTLARSGYEMAVALLNQDMLEDTSAQNPTAQPTGGTQAAVSDLLNQAQRQAAGASGPGASTAGLDTLQDLWARMDLLRIPLEAGQKLNVQVTDLSGRINLNAIITRDASGAEALNKPLFGELVTLLQQAQESLGQTSTTNEQGGTMSAEDIAYAIADWVDADEVRLSDGGFEDEYYNMLEDPYSSKNGPFDSVAELQLVAGIDDDLYGAIKDAVTVYPFEGGGAINPNTAPPIVLASIRVKENPASENPEPLSVEQVGTILDARAKGIAIENDQDLKDLLDLDAGAVFTPSLVYGSNVFGIDAVASVRGTLSRLHAVVDRGGGTPKVLYWRID